MASLVLGVFIAWLVIALLTLLVIRGGSLKPTPSLDTVELSVSERPRQPRDEFNAGDPQQAA